MDRYEIRDAATRWAFRKTFGRGPTPGELTDYGHAIDERERLKLYDALPIFNRLRQSHGAAVPVPVPPKERPRRKAGATERVADTAAAPPALANGVAVEAASPKTSRWNA